LNNAGSAPTYNVKYYEIMAEAGKKHFWFRIRQKIIENYFKSMMIDNTCQKSFLEVGVGVGVVSGNLKSRYNGISFYGIDIYREGLKYAQNDYNLNVLAGDICQPPFKSQFDIVGLFDVIEHIENDDAFLVKTRELLRDKGIIFLTVPACMSLWSYFDEISEHKRRYNKDEIIRKLSKAGFDTINASYFMSLTFPIMYLSRTRGKLKKEEKENIVIKELRPNKLVNTALYYLLLIEYIFLKIGLKVSFGSSLIVLAKRK
jgi:2-polyprenyl-3-methyl-5-hydroxy-6-metoxy-1,4-benzoquinol methylase